MTDEDLIFKALADRTRRLMLDALHEKSGRSLSDLERVVAGHAEMSRFGVAKHLKVLAAADLVIMRKKGREKLHYLNPVPIRLIHDRWIDKYSEAHVVSLTHLKNISEKPHD
ncbi:ArsR/SmtB family transcription factor [Nesterenkonia muleiensis]|uniref:ArsR/SmtB family transcription factor n=1 Tax=Nesterenkonia muleiensis TaxID=2282648 RepID=UPI000E713170|nr:helix-turn-helix domain-containing protein [Nesterenkonia muleiensis]